MISVSEGGLQKIQEIMDSHEKLNCRVIEQDNGVTVVDAGVSVEGCTELGRLIGELCLGGQGAVRLSQAHIGELTLPAVVVAVGEAPIATLGCQFAGWRIKVGDFFAMASGPARAVARVEAELFEELDYSDDADRTVVFLEASQLPSQDVTSYIASECEISPEGLYCVVAPTASIAGSVQISSRIVEVAVHKLHMLGFDVKRIRRGQGVAPIAPVARTDAKAMGLTNDCILYGGRAYLYVVGEEGEDLERLVKQCPSSASEQYGRPFYELFKSVGFDFYKVDPMLFSPAEITLIDVTTREGYVAGEVNPEVLKRSLETYGQ